MSRLIRYRAGEIAICLFFFVILTNESHAGLGPPPTIDAQPSGTSVSNGDSAAFSTTVGLSLTQLQFQWLFNNQPIVTNSAITVNNSAVLNLLGIEIGVMSTLAIHNVSSTNQGNYSVLIQNGGGSVTSSNATLVILAGAVSNVVNIVSTGTGMTASGFKLQLSGPAGSNYVIQASADLVNWVPISTNSAPAGTASYTDTAAKNFPFRYYRATLQ